MTSVFLEKKWDGFDAMDGSPGGWAVAEYCVPWTQPEKR